MSGVTAEAHHHQAFEGANEAALLITSLRAVPIVVPHKIDWQTLRRIAEENGVLGLVHQSLLEAGTEMPDFFTAAAQENRASAERLATELEGLLQDFAERGIDVLPLKGPALAAALYGDAALRTCNDLDLLVRRDDYERAAALLLDLGFTAGTVNDYNGRFLYDGTAVELHFEVVSPLTFRFDVNGIWSRSRRDHFRGKPIRLMCDEDLVLFLCAHGLKHCFSRLIWILDLARALRGVGHRGAKELMQRAEEQDMELWLPIGCEVVRAMFPQELPQAIDAVIAESPEAAKRAHNAAATLISKGLEEVIDRRSFYLQTEESMIRRWCYRLSYLAPTDQDYQWAECHRINRGLYAYPAAATLVAEIWPIKGVANHLSLAHLNSGLAVNGLGLKVSDLFYSAFDKIPEAFVCV
jgi:hypothetical protein